MAGWLRKDAGSLLDSAALGISGAVVQAADTGKRNRRGAHRAWFEGDIKIVVYETFRPDNAARLSDDHDLGVSRRV